MSSVGLKFDCQASGIFTFKCSVLGGKYALSGLNLFQAILIYAVIGQGNPWTSCGLILMWYVLTNVSTFTVHAVNACIGASVAAITQSKNWGVSQWRNPKLATTVQGAVYKNLYTYMSVLVSVSHITHTCQCLCHTLHRSNKGTSRSGGRRLKTVPSQAALWA